MECLRIRNARMRRPVRLHVRNPRVGRFRCRRPVGLLRSHVSCGRYSRAASVRLAGLLHTLLHREPRVAGTEGGEVGVPRRGFRWALGGGHVFLLSSLARVKTKSQRVRGAAVRRMTRVELVVSRCYTLRFASLFLCCALKSHLPVHNDCLRASASAHVRGRKRVWGWDDDCRCRPARLIDLTP